MELPYCSKTRIAKGSARPVAWVDVSKGLVLPCFGVCRHSVLARATWRNSKLLPSRRSVVNGVFEREEPEGRPHNSCPPRGSRQGECIRYCKRAAPSSFAISRSNVPSGRCPALRAVSRTRQSENPRAGRFRYCSSADVTTSASWSVRDS
jgi:hypothetical protein